MNNMIKAFKDKMKNGGTVVGTFVDTIENAHKWRETGVQYLSYSVDVGIFYESCKHLITSIMGTDR